MLKIAFVPNHAVGVDGIRNLLRYGIARLRAYGIQTQECMESTHSVAWNPSQTVWNQDAGKDECNLTVDAIPDKVGIPYALKRDAICFV